MELFRVELLAIKQWNKDDENGSYFNNQEKDDILETFEYELTLDMDEITIDDYTGEIYSLIAYTEFSCAQVDETLKLIGTTIKEKVKNINLSFLITCIDKQCGNGQEHSLLKF